VLHISHPIPKEHLTPIPSRGFWYIVAEHMARPVVAQTHTSLKGASRCPDLTLLASESFRPMLAGEAWLREATAAKLQ